MSRQLLELETILASLITEHRKLLVHIDTHQTAMRTMDLTKMDEAANLQEASRLRIAALDTKRQLSVNNLARAFKVTEQLTIARLAELHPLRKDMLLRLRDELKDLITQIKLKTNIAGRIAGAFLGHLNTVVRLLAGAVEQAGLYTKHGVPRVSTRIGVMEAVG